MKNEISTFKRQLIIVILLFISGLHLFSQGSNVTIDLSQSGTMGVLLTDDQKANTEKLVITTSNGAILDASDFATLNAMPKLKELDLSGDLNTKVLTGDAFADNKTLETIKFPATMNDIHAGVFNNSALKGVLTFPKTLTSQNAIISRFGNCQGITAFEFPDNPGLSSHEGVVYAQNGTVLVKYPCGKEATSYTVPEGCTQIQQQVFFYNYKLENLILPASFSTFLANMDATFRYATALKRIDVMTGNPAFSSIEGLLLDLKTKAFVFFPPAYSVESLVIDGNLVESIPAGFFSSAKSLKRVVFTEGFKSIGYRAFRQAIADVKVPIEYIELPSTIETLDGEAFYGLGSTIKQFVCKATTPPTLTGNNTFRESNYANVRFAVPVSALDAYLHSPFTNGNFTETQIVPYREITVEKGTAIQNASASGFSIQIVAEDAPAGKSFSRWESTPNVSFANSLAASTYLTMPDADVTITAVFEDDRPYIITGATISTNGSRAVGGRVELETDAIKVVGENTLYFKEWKIIKGDGLTIANPKAVSTNFIMIDGEVEIEAVYARVYLIDIVGGNAPFEAFEGETVSVTAHVKTGSQFVNWTSPTAGVAFADATATSTTFVMPASDAVIIANFTGTSIENVNTSGIVLYPNPAVDYIHITGITAGSYVIYNVWGNVVAQGILDSEVNVISVCNLTNGAYFIKAGEEVIRFIKK